MTKILQLKQKDIVRFIWPMDQCLVQAEGNVSFKKPPEPGFLPGWEERFPDLSLETHPTLSQLSQTDQARLALILRTQSGANTPHYRDKSLLDFINNVLVPAGGLPFDYLYLERKGVSLWITAPAATLVLAARAAGEEGVKETLAVLNQKRPHWLKGQQWVWNQANGLPAELSELERDGPVQGLAGEMGLVVSTIIAQLTSAHPWNLQRLLLRCCKDSKARDLVLGLVEKTGIDLQQPSFYCGKPFGPILCAKDRALEHQLQNLGGDNQAASAGPRA